MSQMFLKVSQTQNLFKDNDISNSILCNLDGELLCSSKTDKPQKFASLVSHIWALYLQFPTIDTSQLDSTSTKIPTCCPNRSFHQRSSIQSLEIDNEDGKIVIIGVKPNFLLAAEIRDCFLLNRLQKLAKTLSEEYSKE
eukprot:NODE_20_length_39102_cov_0.325513.p17 type:complete len:139 gc:universal NODE_20_length_39102_cov_0.325513:5378-5794(+)